MEEVLDLDGIDVFTAGDDDVLFAVYQIVEAVLVLHGHISGVEPAVVVQDLFGRLRVVVVADHDAGTFDGQFADLALRHRLTVFINDPAFPLVAGDADGPNLVEIFHAEMDTAGSEGFGQAVVCVVFVVREIFQPVLDHGGRDRLCADVHQAPLVQLIVFKLHAAIVDGIQDILCPGHEKPYHRTFFTAHRPEDDIRRNAAQEHCPAR